MIRIAVETSGRRGSVAVERARAGAGEEGPERRFRALADARAHASDLMPAVDELVRELGARPADVESVLVGTGPGSFTGLRAGMATAMGIARGADARLLGVPSIEAMLWRSLEPGGEAAVLLDARSRELYFAHYRRTEDELVALRSPCVVAPEEPARCLPPSVPLYGDADTADAARLGDGDRDRLRTDVRPDALAVLELGTLRLERSGGRALDRVEPLYLRPFAARVRRR